MLSNEIKQATREAHQQLEVLVVKKLKAIRSKEDYIDLLNRFYMYFRKVETSIQPRITNEVLPDYGDRRNSSFLKRDIEQLGGATGDWSSLQAPAIVDVPSALGALYVLEGSIMGGRIIIQMLGKLGISEGISFFSGYGERNGIMWQRFTEVLNERIVSEADQISAINAANETFRLFGNLFTGMSIA